MRYVFALLLSLFMIPNSVVYATPAQELFLRAHEEYKENNFQQAYDLYNQIPHKSAIVHYNLGNCAYKLKKLGYALLHWRRAEMQWGFLGRKELTNNLKLLKAKLAPTTEEKQKKVFIVAIASSIKQELISCIKSTPLLYLQSIFLLLWILIFIIKRVPVAQQFHSAIMPLLILLCTCGLMLTIKYKIRFSNPGIVTAKKASLRSGPGETFQAIMSVKEGDEGFIKKESDNYYKIALGKKIGWISTSSFEKI